MSDEKQPVQGTCKYDLRMRIRHKLFWDAVLTKLVELGVSVKVWVLLWVSFLVYRIHVLGGGLNQFIVDMATTLPAEKMAILADLQKGMFDISTAMLTGVIVVILLSRETFKHKRLEYDEKLEQKLPDKESTDINSIKDRME